MRELTIDDVLDLEGQVWRALQRGDAQADAALLSEDFVGVYPTGFAGRDDHAGQLDGGPSVTTFELHDARLLAVADDAVLLAYRAEFRRPGSGATSSPESMYVSSLWCRRDGTWVNVFSQDTPVDPGRDVP